MNKNKNLTIKFSACEDAWMCPLVDEVLSHLDLPEKETNLAPLNRTQQDIYLYRKKLKQP